MSNSKKEKSMRLIKSFKGNGSSFHGCLNALLIAVGGDLRNGNGEQAASIALVGYREMMYDSA